MGRFNEKNEGFNALGENVKIYPGAKLFGREYISIGDNVIIDDFVFIYATAPIFIGSYVHIASFTSITGGGTVVLEDFSTLSSGVRVLSGSDDFLGGGLTNSTIPARWRSVTRSFVHIGKHAIIGANSVVLPGVRVQTGTAVGAGSVVNKTLDAWGVYAGSPARRLKERPSQTILESAQAIQDEGLLNPLLPSRFEHLLG